MKKYYTNYVSLIIQEVDVESETDKTVVVSNGVKLFRVAKDTQSGSYQDTRELAKAKLSAHISEQMKVSEYRKKCIDDYLFLLKQSASKL